MDATEFVRRRDEILCVIPDEFHQMTLAAAWRDGMTDENVLIELERQTKITQEAVQKFANRISKLAVEKHMRRNG